MLMNQPLKALIALLPAVVLLLAAGLLFFRLRTVPALLQFLGAGGFVLVALCHLFEGLNISPWMGWGHENSFGHYIDLSSAVLGIVLFPLGYLLHALHRHDT